MKNTRVLNTLTLSLIAAGLFSASSQTFAEDVLDASLDFRLRYEGVEQDNAREDADALTLRTTVNVKTKSFSGWSAVVEFEDVRTVAGVDDYHDVIGTNSTFSVVADPETTELDQAFVQYKSDQFTAKIGRQVITLDDHRFVGHVAWRQDKQTFDALSGTYSPTKDLKVYYAYLDKRNRIFGEERDLDSKDHLFNISYQTPIGKLVGYSYLLEVDNGTDNSIDTYGAYLSGAKPVDDMKLLYHVQYATQSADAGGNDFDADFYRVEGGVAVSGITTKLGIEVLGSDDSQYGFATPLATLHKFNGWSDQFLGTPAVGLQDVYVSVTGSLFGGKWLAAYHDFSADDSTPSVDDLGDEINLQYVKKYKGVVYGAKYAAYSAGDIDAGKVDTDKLWLWVQKTF